MVILVSTAAGKPDIVVMGAVVVEVLATELEATVVVAETFAAELEATVTDALEDATDDTTDTLLAFWVAVDVAKLDEAEAGAPETVESGREIVGLEIEEVKVELEVD